jgi:hypothetical protein
MSVEGGTQRPSTGGKEQQMKAISRPAHGVIDYTVAATLVAMPLVMRTDKKTRTLFWGMAAGHALYSMFTRYEVGVVKAIPFRGHLLLDGVFAAGWLAAATLMRDESAQVRATMVAIGASESVAIALTDPDATTQAEALAGEHFEGLGRGADGARYTSMRI